MERRSSIIGGLILIAVGGLFLLLQLFPGLSANINMARQWPLIIVAVGGFFLVGALFGTPPLAIPASVIGGIGSILYYQNLTGNWASWAYIWALIPGFAGIGTVLMGLLERKKNGRVREGLRLMGISLALFVVFGLFFNGFGGLGQFWPVLLIIAGGWILLQNLRGR